MVVAHQTRMLNKQDLHSAMLFTNHKAPNFAAAQNVAKFVLQLTAGNTMCKTVYNNQTTPVSLLL